MIFPLAIIPHRSFASFLSKMIPLFDKDADSFITEEELKGHIAYMQKRYVLNDVDRTWKGHPTEDNKLSWKEYRESVYGPESQ